jgi:4-hydroxy-3-methylbut-2-enyl diphosphate reductase
VKIELASSYGFCFGVKRAIKLAENNRGAFTLGPLIHNQKEISRLKSNYDVGIKDLEDVHNSDTIIIRTHGVSKDYLVKLKNTTNNIVDATCPFVTKPQEICQSMDMQGYDIVIFGDIDHPEVKGVKSYASNPYVVLSIDDLERVKLKDKIAVVSQTTKKKEDFLEIVNYLILKYKEVRVFNTICNATFDNQNAAKNLSKDVDVMVVIGGKNSSNTKQLHSICKENCSSSYLIEGCKELEANWFKDKKFCGVTAGASTPDWIINNVIEKIKKISV